MRATGVLPGGREARSAQRRSCRAAGARLGSLDRPPGHASFRAGTPHAPRRCQGACTAAWQALAARVALLLPCSWCSRGAGAGGGGGLGRAQGQAPGRGPAGVTASRRAAQQGQPCAAVQMIYRHRCTGCAGHRPPRLFPVPCLHKPSYKSPSQALVTNPHHKPSSQMPDLTTPFRPCPIPPAAPACLAARLPAVTNKPACRSPRLASHSSIKCQVPSPAASFPAPLPLHGPPAPHPSACSKGHKPGSP